MTWRKQKTNDIHISSMLFLLCEAARWQVQNTISQMQMTIT